MKKPLPLYMTILLDILLSGVFLLLFAFFHHVLPAMRFVEFAAPIVTAAPEIIEEPAPVIETTPAHDMRSEWQIKYAEHFTNDVIITDNSYQSPNVSVTIDTVKTLNDYGNPVCYYVADIYISDMSCFTTQTPNGELQYFLVDEVENLDAQADAILSISGDFMSYQRTGFLMRNGEIYRNDYAWCDICVLFSDGSMKCCSSGSYSNQEIIDAGAVQVWNFGPSLLDENGAVKSGYDVSTAVAYANPRSAIGYYEPGHYCFVVVDGRQEASAGMTVPELARVFEGLGCTCAYNLDGGGSAVMMFRHERRSVQSNGGNRNLGDILVIKESEVNR